MFIKKVFVSEEKAFAIEECAICEEITDIKIINPTVDNSYKTIIQCNKCGL